MPKILMFHLANLHHPATFQSLEITFFITGNFSPLSSLGDIGRMLANVQGVFTPNSAPNTPTEESPLKDENDEVSNKNRLVFCFVTILLYCL